MLKNREVNPLAVFNLRQLAFCPPHFQKITFSLITNFDDILDWIHENTESRFYISRMTGSANVCVAFETHSETTYFALMLQDINSVKNFY